MSSSSTTHASTSGSLRASRDLVTFLGALETAVDGAGAAARTVPGACHAAARPAPVLVNGSSAEPERDCRGVRDRAAGRPAGSTNTSRPSEPAMIRSPARSVWPHAASVSATKRTISTRFPAAAAASIVSTSSPFRTMRATTSRSHEPSPAGVTGPKDTAR